MATKKQKEELIELLKFTPTKVTVYITGYGGETYAGTVDRKVYDYFRERRLSIEDYAGDWDNEMSVPDDLQPFPAGSPYECDNIFHEGGAELSNLNTITVYNDKNEIIWECAAGYSELDDQGVECEGIVEKYISEYTAEGKIVFWGGNGEKGTFFDGEIELRAPFDPKKLKITYMDCDGWELIGGVEYEGEEIDGSSGYSTTGKWSENKWVLPEGVDSYEPEEIDDAEEDNKDDAVNNSADPEYECVQCDWQGTVDQAVYNSEDEMICPECGEPIELKDNDLDWDAGEELQKLFNEFPVEPAVTDWFPVEVKPVRKGEYEAVIDAPWPLSGVRRIEWTGRSWREDGKKIAIIKWRGLAVDPTRE